MHSALQTQLSRLGLNKETPPDQAQWQALLKGVDFYYTTTERSTRNLERTLSNLSQHQKTSTGGFAPLKDGKQGLAEIVLRAVGLGLCWVNEEGQVQLLNEAAEKMLGWKETELLGQHFLSQVEIPPPDQDTETAEQLSRALADGIPYTNTTALFLCKDESQIPVHYVLTPVQEDEQVVGSVLIFSDSSEIRQAEARLSYEATHDALTGISNRTAFERRLSELAQESQHAHSRHALLYLDLDRFKQVNDTCGHIAGDELLKQVSDLLQANLRATDMLARLGGDEFGILLPQCPMEQATIICATLIDAVSAFKFSWDDKSFEVGASIGLASVNRHNCEAGALLKQADSACYRAKENGRNRVHVYKDKDGETPQSDGSQWQEQIRNALTNNRFFLYCQEIIPVVPRSVDSPFHEILLRMRDDKNQLILPGAFMSAAERYQLSTDIDIWVVSRVLRFLRAKNAEQISKVPSIWSINLFGSSIRSQKFLEFMQENGDVSGLDGHVVCLELSEPDVVANLKATTDFIAHMQELGYRFILDNYGSGHASFSYLRNLPVDYIKIQGSYVKEISRNQVDKDLVDAINRIAQSMGKKTIGHFVSNIRIMHHIREIGVDYIQGYAVGEPTPLGRRLS